MNRWPNDFIKIFAFDFPAKVPLIKQIRRASFGEFSHRTANRLRVPHLDRHAHSH